jgi:hypothetical protein
MTTKKADTGRKPGNQTPNTPEFSESETARHGWKGVDTGKHPGNQSPNTPDTREGDRQR